MPVNILLVTVLCLGFVQTHHFQANFVARLWSLTRQQCTGYVDSLCCFDSNTSWPIFYHVNSIDLTAHPSEEDFSLLWDGIRFLSHTHTITGIFPKHLRLSHWTRKKKKNQWILYNQEKHTERTELHHNDLICRQHCSNEKMYACVCVFG